MEDKLLEIIKLQNQIIRGLIYDIDSICYDTYGTSDDLKWAFDALKELEELEKNIDKKGEN